MRKASGFNILLELITLAHLHTSRAVIPTQTQAIEGVGIEKGHEKEWYYGTEAKDRNGPIRPLPTVKRILSEPNTLPHIVQLLVTFDPVLVEQVTRIIMYLPS